MGVQLRGDGALENLRCLIVLNQISGPKNPGGVSPGRSFSLESLRSQAVGWF